jgi:hypothetical protein
MTRSVLVTGASGFIGAHTLPHLQRAGCLIEVYHCGLKQFTGIERGQFRLEIVQHNHIGLAIRAFIRLEAHRLQQQISYFEAKSAIIRDAIRAYLAHPTLVLKSTA